MYIYNIYIYCMIIIVITSSFSKDLFGIYISVFLCGSALFWNELRDSIPALLSTGDLWRRKQLAFGRSQPTAMAVGEPRGESELPNHPWLFERAGFTDWFLYNPNSQDCS